MSDRANLRRRMGATASWTVLGLALVCAPHALAQAGAQAGPSAEAAQEPSDAEIQDVLVVGTRASQQSAIDRKRNARTATDSIVADDIGSFPDRNINEAISRVPGVALTRNEFGEGEGVALRGNGPNLTRVELDGIGVQSTNGISLGIDNRGADMRELPAELVKSIDVVKGSTADMTEGGLGGSIQIKTRTGLDFTKPYFSLRAGAQQNSLGKKWTPDFNAVAAKKFFDDRLGVIVSGTYYKVQNNGHNYENTTSNSRNYARLYDFDQSPEKTFSYNLDTLGTDAADTALTNSIGPNGSPLTPRQFLTMASAASTKQDCVNLFPNNPALNTAQRQQRILEQQSCLAQWNDYTPSLIRHLMNSQDEERYSIDARFDYRVTDNLTVYVKGMYNSRHVDDRFRTRTPISLFNANPAGSFVDSGTYPAYRTVSPNSPFTGYYLYDPNYGLNAVTTGSGNSQVVTPTYGNVLNVVPSSIVVDENHNVTKMTLTNNSVGIDEINNIIDSNSKYAQIGAEWRNDRLLVEAMAGITKTKTTRGDMRTNRSYMYGDATLTLQPNGLWDIDLPDGYDESNPANFVQLSPARCVNAALTPPNCIGQNAVAAGPNGPATPAYTVGQMPLTTPLFSVSYSPRLGEASERIAKLDLTYDTDDLIPFVKRVKVGGMYRNNKLDTWGGGGYTVKGAVGTFGQPGYVPAVIVPTANVRGNLRACEPTAGSSAPGGLSCNYGFVPSTNPANVRSGVDTLTPQELRDLFARTSYNQKSEYFGDLPNRGDLPPAWAGINTSALFSALGASQFMNFDCLKQCMGSDGQMYDQPVTRTEETIKNVYAMFDFEQPLPLGLLFNGNVGVRGVFARVKGSALLTIDVITKTPAFNPANPNAAAGIFTQRFQQNTTVDASTNDWLPSFNLNLWGFNESVVLRLYGGKTISRPNPSQLLPGGTCTIDERIFDNEGADAQFGCPGRVGNPSLSPFTAWNYNAALEWYPNRDTLLSVAYGKLDVKTGNPIAVSRQGNPFTGSDVIDPLTGRPISELQFNYPTWENGPGYSRNIWEFNVKAAFTFLPWFLRHTGFDGNVSILESSVTSGQRDPLSGDFMLPPDESKYYWNGSLWYDDGKLNIRVAYQKRSSRFLCITPCGGNNIDFNYPGEGWTNVRMPYNPGVARYADGSTFIDAKISYNINRNFQVYLEARNITRESQTISTGEYLRFADDTPRIMRHSYSGRRILGGVRIQFGGK